MSHRVSGLLILHCLACANAGEASDSSRDRAHREPMDNVGATQPPVEPGPVYPPCGSYACAFQFTVTLEASEPWPLGRYFLRVSVNDGPPTVCEIAFEPVVGAVTDTCDDEWRGFEVSYRYDGETRAIEMLSFGAAQRVDMEILVGETMPPVVEVHHDVVVQKCSIACEIGEPLTVPVQLRSMRESERDAGGGDAGGSDAGDGTPDAAAAAAL